MRYDCYLFDLDGTLTDSQEGIFNAVKYALKKLGEPIPPLEVLRRFIGPPLDFSFREYCGFDDEKITEGVKLYREYYNNGGLFENRVYEGIVELLTELKIKGRMLAVATSKPELFTGRILAHFGLDKYFDVITGALTDGTRSTKSDVLACALKNWGIKDKSKAVMIGDRMHDIVGAKDNGIDCIAVLWGFGDREEFEEYKADYIVEKPADILDI